MKAYKVTFALDLEENATEHVVHYLDAPNAIAAGQQCVDAGYIIENIISIERISDKSGLRTKVDAHTGTIYTGSFEAVDEFGNISFHYQEFEEFAELARYAEETETKLHDVKTRKLWTVETLVDASLYGWDWKLKK